MRIYELAKKYNVPSKDLLVLLNDKGFELSSHMAVATEEVLDYVAKLYAPSDQSKKARSKVTVEKKVVETAEKQVSPVKENVVAEAVAVKAVSVKENPVVAPKIVAPKEKSQSLQELPHQAKPDISRRVLQTEADVARLQSEIEFQIGSGSSDGQSGARKGYRSSGSGKSQGHRGGRRRRRSHGEQQQQREQEVAPITEVFVEKDMPVFDVAVLLGKSVSEIVLSLLKQGLVCGKNNMVPVKTIESLAGLYEISVIRKSNQAVDAPLEVVRQVIKDDSKTAVTRWPVVVVMGHVDHGKTTLLDYVRKMKVAASEKGGITQHLGAYEVDSKHGKIIFLDTPGHEAFSYIRQRGTKITDIAVLVIAADDGIKPQTLEAIKHAQQAKVPVVVAINKIDKVSSPSAIETIKRQLAQHGLMPEDWGGQTICVPISAKTGAGVEELLEMIVLQSQLMDLKTEPNAPVRAFVLESHQERGLGSVATVICAEGTIKVGDYFACGQSTGKVRLLINSHGKRLQKAGPSVPVKVIGFDTFVSIGDWLEVVPQAEYVKRKSVKPTKSLGHHNDVASFGQSASTGKQEKNKFINIIVKADTRGSYEALTSAIDRLMKKHKEIICPIIIVSGGVGDIIEGDIDLAANTNSIVYGLHVRAEKNALMLAKEKELVLHSYDIIYNLIDDLEKLLLSKKEVVKTWKKTGKAVVRRVFNMKGVGVIAGCYMTEGTLNRTSKVVCVRDGQEIGEGKVSSLQRDKKHVKEVHAGFECGFLTDSFHEWEEGDVVICLNEVVEQST